VTTFSPSGKKRRIMHTRWKKNTPGALAAGHPDAAYIATADAAYGVDFMNKVRKGLASGGPSFIHVLDPCPKGWHFDPQYSHEMGKLAVETGIWPLWEMENHTVKLNGTTKQIAAGRYHRKPVRDYLSKQGRFAHFADEDYDLFQRRVDDQWANWLVPGVISFGIEAGTPLNVPPPAAAAVPAAAPEA
jgi:pyruvate ferredoxin oxidoreductase beta subunit